MNDLLPVVNVLGRLLAVFSLVYLMPAASALHYDDGTLVDFLLAMVLASAIGLLLHYSTRRHFRELKPRDGFLLVTAAWTLTPLWMLFLSCITASSGSTGGGIKMIRTLILANQASRELTRLIHPAVVNPVKVGANAIPNAVVVAVLGFIFLYFISVVLCLSC